MRGRGAWRMAHDAGSKMLVISFRKGFFGLGVNGWRYIFVADFGARLFQTTMMLKRATTVDFSTIFGNEIYRLLPPGVLPSSLVNHCLY
jgi:hypothetical protein